MDASADVVRSPEGDGTPEGVEPGSLLWARQHIEEVKVRLRDAPGRAYSVHFTAAAEMLREHDPVQFRSLRSLLKTKLIRLGEFDRLIDQRRRERVESRKRKRTVAAESKAEGGLSLASWDETGGLVLGRIEMRSKWLVLEVNSLARADRGKQMIGQLSRWFGRSAGYRDPECRKRAGGTSRAQTLVGPGDRAANSCRGSRARDEGVSRPPLPPRDRRTAPSDR